MRSVPPVQPVCHECRTPIPTGASFCAQCGHKFDYSRPQWVRPAPKKANYRVKLLVGLAIAALIVGGLAWLGSTLPATQSASNSDSPTPNSASGSVAPEPTSAPEPGYTINMSGGMPNPQSVGEIETLNLTVVNTGDDIPNLTLWFQGLGSWVIDGMTSDCNLAPEKMDVMGNGDAWNFGALSANNTCKVSLLLDPSEAGNHSISIDAYYDLDGTTGMPDMNKTFLDTSLSWDGAINP